MPQELVVQQGGMSSMLATGTDQVAALNMLAPSATSFVAGFSETTSTYALSTGTTDARSKAKLQGYTGDSCGECGNYTMVRNGSCL